MSHAIWSTRKQHPFDQMPRYQARAWHSVRYMGRSHNMAAFQFLLGLCLYRYRLEKSGQPIPVTWLLPFRNDFRELTHHNNAVVVKSFLQEGGPSLRHVFIWLLSGYASRFSLLGIDQAWNDPSPQVRKHVAKALRRLENRQLLGRMLSAFPADDAIWRIATAPLRKRPFQERLHNFTVGVDDSHADEVHTPSRMPFWASEDSWECTPPKSIELIRRILRRIQHWVHWGVN